MKTICIDIDGTLVHYEAWCGEKYFGEVLPYAKEIIMRLHNEGWFIIIYTTRSNKDIVARFLNESSIYFDAINENPDQPNNAKGGKPLADIYLDDRALTFTGDWQQTYRDIQNFVPWEERKSDECSIWSNELLKDDFVQTYEQIRHYDKVNWEVTKFAIAQVLLVIGACWTILTIKCNGNLEMNITGYFDLMIAVICSISVLSLWMVIWVILKNRVYFCRASRHINEIRKQAVLHNSIGFLDINRYYVDVTKPTAGDYFSTQLVSLYLLTIIQSIMLFAFVYFVLFVCDSHFALLYIGGFKRCVVAMICAIVSILIVIIVSHKYLKNK